jgi:hypothetical protein
MPPVSHFNKFMSVKCPVCAKFRARHCTVANIKLWLLMSLFDTIKSVLIMIEINEMKDVFT